MIADDIVYYAAFVLPIILILLYFFTNYNFTGEQAKFYQRLFKIGGAVYAVTFLANYVSLTGNASNSMTLTDYLMAILILFYLCAPFFFSLECDCYFEKIFSRAQASGLYFGCYQWICQFVINYGWFLLVCWFIVIFCTRNEK
ncbi:hypothetical protein [Lactococcus cremoris]|uniref:Membrane protein n=1 Tax=Lactococcus lactis subsp. cremoris TaxID=1359 RepID=A0ABR5EF89_LACLC|nr:hypothetical protein [Lactococcus cremoris]KKW71284.1 membrane protein [Lactococcus cremoris]